MKVKSIAECSSWSILQYFWPALSDNQSWKPNFGLRFGWPLKAGFTVLLLCHASLLISGNLKRLKKGKGLKYLGYYVWANISDAAVAIL